MTPDCCKGCPRLKEDGACANKAYKCTRWRNWFRGEWARIRRAANDLKQQEQTRR